MIKEIGGLQNLIDESGNESLEGKTEEEVIEFLLKERFYRTLESLSRDSEVISDIRMTYADWSSQAHCDENEEELRDAFDEIVSEVCEWEKTWKLGQKHYLKKIPGTDRKEKVFYEENIIYYQNANGEQIDLSIESSLPTKVYSSSDSMNSFQKIYLEEAQLNYQKESNTKWIIDVNLKGILSEFLFATLKRYRTFEGVTNGLTVTNDVNTSLTQYINNNVLDRYKFSRLDLYISYKDLRSQNVLRFKNTWNQNISTESNLVKKRQTDVAFDGSKLKIIFTQEKPSTQYNFDYYFNILFEKI